MKLEIGNFYVKDVVFGDKTFFENGILTINKKKRLVNLFYKTNISQKLI